MIKLYFILFLMINSFYCFSKDGASESQTISTAELLNFDTNPTKVKAIIEMGLDLADQHLAYQYGSADPRLGGMDCSGTMYYLLIKAGVKPVPRSSQDLYNWIITKGVFNKNDGNLTKLHPGDLLFWTGTYAAPNNSYVTHVMLYIGKNLKGEHLMLGSSDGRTYKGKQIFGVSVFDFIPPTSNLNNKFLGYSCIPQLSC